MQDSKDVKKQEIQSHSVSILVIGFSLLLLCLWGFPRLWYTHIDEHAERYWFSAMRELEGYAYVDHALDEAMERRLVADETFNGQFVDENQQVVLAFMAKRHEESMDEIGLFVHTPDRCWTEGGWKIQPIQPDYVEVEIHGQKIGCERRLFVAGARHELVYFTGMVGGQTLPYRLDHNLSVAMKYQLESQKEEGGGTTQRMIDSKLWGRVWDAFVSRRPLLGPKQFIRISTTINPDEPQTGDQLLQDFLQQWLQKVDYQQELESWKQSETSA